ncbi:T9SS C-terminal target domain-containing protein [candidate division KSB1 bacterium]|nr:T9SS type A sorting domain-containing protein [candidate division KSB1 bacterium]RQW02048.1 MAG: T9SS C-terminal target domain-containing protein [candidate division KSB1 bacterium]
MKAIRHMVALSALCSIFFTPALFCQINWTPVSNQPVLGTGPEGGWDGGCTVFPIVIKEGDTLKMWYSGLEGEMPIGPWRKGFAWSTDGVNWQRHPGNPIDLQFEVQTIIKEGDSYKGWGPIGWGDKAGIMFYTTSSNGIDWTTMVDTDLQRGGEQDWDGVPYFRAGPVIKDETEYKMWYMGSKGQVAQIGYATSADGLHWVKYDDPTTTEAPFANSDPVLKVGNSPAWDSQAAFDHWVIRTENGYEMWYTGYGIGQMSIGYATSADGISWTKSPDNPIFKHNPPWGSAHFTPCVLLFDNTYHMWYSSYTDNSGQYSAIGYMTSVETDVKTGKSDVKYPDAFALTNHPNPFNPETTIEFALEKNQFVSLEIRNLQGELVETLKSKMCGAGSHTVTWNAAHQPSGLYLCRLRGEHFSQVRKMLLVR